MEKIKQLVTQAVEASKSLLYTDFPAVIEVWENAVKELKESECNKPEQASAIDVKINKPNTLSHTKAQSAINGNTIIKRSRGRPRKIALQENTVPEQEKNVAESNIATLKSDSDTSNTNIVKSRRQSTRSIVPSKRYPNLAITLIQQKNSNKDDAHKETKTVEIEQNVFTVEPVKEVEVADIATHKQSDINSSEKSDTQMNKQNVTHFDSDKYMSEEDDSDPKYKSYRTVKTAHKTVNESSLLVAKASIPCSRHQCTTCGKVLTNSSNLIVHMRKHNGEKPFICKICKKHFSAKSNLKRHEKTHTGVKPYSCVECGKCFTEKKSLIIHNRQHTGERPFKCPYCPQRFSQSGTLRTHINIHKGIKAFLCDYCGKPFRQRGQLRIHMMRHKNIRNYKCDVCNDTFISKGDRDRHSLRHSGERPYMCSVCPKTFTRLQYLKEHLNRHDRSQNVDRRPVLPFDKNSQKKKKLQIGISPILPHVCKVCNVTTENVQEYVQHLKVHENDQAASFIQEELKSLVVNAEGQEGVIQDGEAQETFIVVLDQSVIDGMCSDDDIIKSTHTQDGMEKILVSQAYEMQSQGDASLAPGMSKAENHVTLVSEEALHFLQHSNLSSNEYQTLIVTEKQIPHLQQLNLQSGDVVAIQDANDMTVSHSGDPSTCHATVNVKQTLVDKVIENVRTINTADLKKESP